MYVGMAIDFDLPSDTGNVWNTPGFDSTLYLLYQQGYGEETTLPGGNRFDSLYAGIAHLGSAPYGGHIIPNDCYIYPQSGYRDDSLYAVMSTPGFSIIDPKDTIPADTIYRTVDWNSVMTFAHISEGYLNTAEVKGTCVIAVSTKGLQVLKDRVKMIMCGNANRDDKVNLGDVIYIAKYKMAGGDEPWLYMSDVNNDCAINLGDVIHLAKYLFGYPGFDLDCNCGE